MFILEFLFPKKINSEEDFQLLILDKIEMSRIIDEEEYSYVLVVDKSKMSWIDRFFCFIFSKEMIYYEKIVRLEDDIDCKTKTAFEFLKYIKECGYYLPMSTERPCTEASNAEIKRWLKSSSVIINGKKPNVNDEIEFPITELVYFPKGKRRTTVR